MGKVESKREQKMYKKELKEIKAMEKASNKLPTQAILKRRQDRYWNLVPLGVCIGKKGKKQILGWYLNDQNFNDDAFESVPSTSLLISGVTGSGTSVVKKAIISHIHDYPGKFQLIGSDIKRIEFLCDADKFNSLLLDVRSTADAVALLQNMMMERFKLMEKYKVNNIYKLENIHAEVPYYEIRYTNKLYQFDKIFTIDVNLDETDPHYGKLKMWYPTGKQPKTITIEQIYNALQDGTLKEAVVDGNIITKDNITRTTGMFKANAIVFMADELAELMTSEDYKSVDTIKTALGSIARLGRAAGVHLVLCCQRASGSVISTDLKNNIQMSILLGGFDDGASTLIFEQDLSRYCKPQIKGRGFIQTGNNILETQIFEGKESLFI